MLRKLTSGHGKKESGFTLIELLVVVLVIGILAAIAVPIFLNQRDAANEAALKSDVKNAGTILGGQSKFTGSLPPDIKTSPGVTLVAMRKADRNNKITASQFIDGQAPNWQTFLNNGAAATTQIITNAGDGYQGMNYRRITTTTGVGTSGQYVSVPLPSIAQNGQRYMVGAAMRHSYSGCRDINIEFWGDSGFNGGISTTNVCFTKDQWTYFEAPGTINGNGVNRIVMSLYANNVPVGQTFDVTGAVLVQGTTIDAAAALDLTGYDYCVQGYHSSNPANIWSYSNLDGGLRNQPC